MNGILSSRDRRLSVVPRDSQGSRRRRSSGRRRQSLDFDPLECRRLLSISNPVAEFPLRDTGGTPEAGAYDGSGNLWVLLSNQNISEIGGSGAEYHIPTYGSLGVTPTGSELGLLTYDAVDGDLWFYETNSNQFGSLNPASGAINEYPALAFATDPLIKQITAGPDGNIWFTEPNLNQIGMFDVTTGQISQFTMPVPDTQPQGIVVGADGNLYFTEGGLNKLGSLNPFTHVLNNIPYELPTYTTNDQAEGIATGPNNTIWFVETENNSVVEFDIKTQAFTKLHYPIAPFVYPTPNPLPNPPGPSADLFSIAEGPDGNMYYTEPSYGAEIGVYDPSSGAANYIVPAPQQPSPNLTGALIVPGTTGTTVNIIDPASGAISNFGTPVNISATPPLQILFTATGGATPASDANDVISLGGQIYYTDDNDINGEIGAFDPATQINTMFPLPPYPTNPPPQQDPGQMAVDDNGNIWVTETTVNAIQEFSPTSGYGGTIALTTLSSNPTGLSWDSIEQLFWITEPGANQIVSFDPKTTGSAVAPVLTPNETIQDPIDILVDPSTGYLWISEGSADKIIEYSPENEQILYSYSTKGSTNQMVWGPDGNIWFGESGYVGVVKPGTGIVTEIPVSGTANYVAVAPSTDSGGQAIWFTESGSNQIGEIDVNSQSLVGYVTAPDTNALAMALGPDGNLWFSSGQGNPGMMGAVVLNPNDLAGKVVITSQPPNVEETIFGGLTWGFGTVVSIESVGGQTPDPFVQAGTITIALDSNPGNDTLEPSPGQSLTESVVDGQAIFGGMTMAIPAQGYTIQATYSLGLNAPVSNRFDVAGQPTQLIVTEQPTQPSQPTPPPIEVQAGVTFTVTITAVDALGSVVPSFDDPVLLSIDNNPSPGNGVLNGTSPVGAIFGVALFDDLTIDQAGNGYTLQATDDQAQAATVLQNPAAPAVTDPFDVVPGPATRLVYAATGEPVATATAGQDFAASPHQVVVDAEDQFGSIATSYNGPVTLALANNVTGAFVGTLTVNAVHGVATFTDLAIDTAGTYQLEATSASLTPSTSTSITITAAAPSQLAWTTEPPSKATELDPLGATLDVEDQYGNLETGYTQNVSVTLDLNGHADNGELGGTTTVAASGGVATFSNIIIDTIGTPYTLIASTGSVTSAASSAIDVVAPQLVVTTEPPSSVTAGSGFGLTVTAETYQGTTDTFATGSVVLSVESGPSGGTVTGTTSATVTNGVATFSGVTLAKVGTYVLQASDGNATPGLTSNITVVAGVTVAQLYVVSQPPASVQAGAVFSFVVGAEDQYGNPTSLTGSVSVAIAANPGSSTLGGTKTVTASGGVATFSNLTLNKVGDGYTLQATAGTLNVTSSKFDVTPGPATQLVYAATGEPVASAAAGQDFAASPNTVVVDVEDQFGNIATSYSGPVTISLANGATGTFDPSSVLTVNASSGVATFSKLAIDTAGTYKLSATSTSIPALTAGTSTSITITSAAQAKQLVWTVEPPSKAADLVPLSVTLAVVDQYGNPITGYDQNVTIALDLNGHSDNGALSGTTTVAASSGVAAFTNIIINTTGNPFTLIGTSGSLPSATSSAIDVEAPQLVWSTEPPSQVAHGFPFGATVDLLDPSGNLETSYNGNVTVKLDNNPAGGALGGTTTIAASGGVAKFAGLTINAIGNGYTLQASSDGVSTAASSGIDVTRIPASSLEVTTQPPTSVSVNQGFSLKVTALDVNGDPDADFTGSVGVSITGSPGSGILGGTQTVSASGGVASFAGLTLDKVGSYTLDVTSTGLSTVTTGTIGVTAGAAKKLVAVSEPPSSETAGGVFSFEVEAEDQYGNLATGFNGTVSASLSSNAGGATLSGEPVTATASGGMATLTGLAVDKAGSGYTIAVTSGGLTGLTSGAFDVAAGPLSELVMASQPSGTVTAGSPFSLTVAGADSYGNTVASFGGAIALSLSNDPAVGPLVGMSALNGVLTGTASHGLATFAGLTLDVASSGYTIAATTAGLNPGQSNALDVVAGAATQLALTVAAPTVMTAGADFGLAISAEDGFGNVVTGFRGPIALRLSANPGDATLSGGALSKTAVGGVVNFGPALTIKVASSGYTLAATSPGLTSVTTGGIAVVPGTATQLVVETEPPSSVTPGQGFGLVVAGTDAYGNVNPNFAGSVVLSAPSGSGAILGGSTTQPARSGVATFAGLTLGGASVPVSLPVVSTGLAGTTTTPVGLAGASQLAFASGGVSVDETSGTATLQVLRTGSLGQAVTVEVSTSGGTAVAGVNYTSVNQELTFAAGQSSQTITIPVKNAGSLASPLTVNVVLSSPVGSGASLGSPSSSTVTILNAGQTTTPTSTPLVTLSGVQIVKKKGKVKEVVLGFSGGLNGSEATSIGEYELIVAGKHGSFTAKNAKVLKLRSAAYNGTTHTVALTPKKGFVLKKPVELIVDGEASSGLEDSSGRLIDGNHDGQAGGNAVSVLTRRGATISALTARTAAVDAVLAHGELVAVTKVQKI